MKNGAGTEDPASVIAACRRLHAAIDALDQAAADLLGVSRNDLRCLNLLEHAPIPPSKIATSLRLTTGSVTAMIDRLEAKGLVARARDQTDRRGIIVSATLRVFQVLGPLYRSCAQSLQTTVEGYPKPEQRAAVRHFVDAAEAWERAANGAQAQ